jgi:hypothetical protein
MTVEQSLKAKLNELLRLRRQYLTIDADRAAIRADGNKVYRAFEKEFRASLKPGKSKADGRN